MENAGILFILVQIDEAHSTAWPIGLPNTVAPQNSFVERVIRANEFASLLPHNTKSFILKIDGWNNEFANTYKAWPDAYYLVDSSLTVLAKSTYGATSDALIDIDCVDLIKQILSQSHNFC